MTLRHETDYPEKTNCTLKCEVFWPQMYFWDKYEAGPTQIMVLAVRVKYFELYPKQAQLDIFIDTNSA